MMKQYGYDKAKLNIFFLHNLCFSSLKGFMFLLLKIRVNRTLSNQCLILRHMQLHIKEKGK